jgi:hypothetical protein
MEVSSHFLKTSTRRRKEVHTPLPCGARRRVPVCDTYVNSFWSFGWLGPKRTQLKVLLVIVFHEVGFADYINRPPVTLKRIKSNAKVCLCLLLRRYQGVSPGRFARGLPKRL